MSQVFKKDGTVVPITLLEVGPCVVTQIKTVGRDGYSAAQIGFGYHPKLKKPLKGHLKKCRQQPHHLREVQILGECDLKVGDVIRVGDVFKRGKKVTVTGTSKGKGFAGVVKRWGFHGGPKTRGQSDRHRAPGSIGTQRDGHVMKGKKMAGRTGQRQISVKGLRIIDLDQINNTIRIKGAVPGSRNSFIIVNKVSYSES